MLGNQAARIGEYPKLSGARSTSRAQPQADAWVQGWPPGDSRRQGPHNGHCHHRLALSGRSAVPIVTPGEPVSNEWRPIVANCGAIMPLARMTRCGCGDGHLTRISARSSCARAVPSEQAESARDVVGVARIAGGRSVQNVETPLFKMWRAPRRLRFRLVGGGGEDPTTLRLHETA